MVKKNCEVWQKMGLFGPDSDLANQLQNKKILRREPLVPAERLIIGRRDAFPAPNPILPGAHRLSFC